MATPLPEPLLTRVPNGIAGIDTILGGGLMPVACTSSKARQAQARQF